MEFIENNYVWIIVIGVIVVMTIIGYFADKADKTEKVPKQKKEKDLKKNNDLKEEIPEIEVPTTEMDDSFTNEWDENNKPVIEENDVINVEGTANTNDWNTLPTEEVNNNYEVPTEANNVDTVNTEMDNSFVMDDDKKNTEEQQMDDEINWDTEVSDSVEPTEEVNQEPAQELTSEPTIEVQSEEVDHEPVEEEKKVETEPVEEVEPVTEIGENPIESNVEPEVQEEIPEQNDDLDDLEITLPNIETLNDEIKDTDDDDDVWKF